MEGPEFFNRLTESSRAAVNIAYQCALMNSRSNVAGLDLLAGISQVHGQHSPLIVLLHHFAVNIDHFYAALHFDPAKLPETAPPAPVESVLSGETYDILQMGFKLALQYNKRDDPPLTRLNDLFGALLEAGAPVRDVLEQALSTAGVKVSDIARAYHGFLKNPDKAEFADFLRERWPRIEAEAIRRAVTGFGADTRGTQDLVGIGAEIDAFAYLICARALQPPLAIGLFGDWGSGKTYFMQSLKERIHQITAEARKSGRPQKSVSVFKYVVQIEFNAWHYVEGELWASLVEHIFNNLQTRENERPTLLEERQKFWADKIAENRRKQLEVMERQQQIDRQIDEKRKRIAVLEKERDEKIRQLEEYQNKNPLDDVQLSEEQTKKWRAFLKEMGIAGAITNAQEFSAAFDEFRSVYGQGKELAMLLRRRGWAWSMRLAVALFSGPALSGLISLIGKDQFPVVVNALLGVSTFLSVATAVLRQGTAQLDKTVAGIKKAQGELDAGRSRVEAGYRAQMDALKSQIEPIDKEHQSLVIDQKRLVEESRQLESEAKKTTPGRVMMDFIEERVGSQDYRKWLGVPALIRRDFDQLSSLIVATNREYVKNDAGKIEEDSHNINRIVLYIDDLDRCPPEKVAKVLQAVHLLLAFPLFVVVVAVDARWLSQSLQKYYSGLLASPADETDEAEPGFSPRATPQDYLEKIFQVPYWVRSLNKEARFNIVKGLVKDSLKRLGEVEQEVSPVKDLDKSKISSEMRNMEKYLAQAGSGPQPVYDKSTPISSTPPGLEIMQPELQFMNDLKPLLGLTPRSVKRFVNVYWLMKSIALARPEEAPFLGSDKYAQYKQVLFLLAVLTGLPGIAHEFFRELCPDASSPTAGKCAHNTLSEFMTALEKKTARSGIGRDDAGSQSDLRRLKTWAESYDKGSWLTLPTSLLGAWAPEVARFSYRMEHI